MNSNLFRAETESPVGVLTIVTSDAGLRAILWPDDDPKRVRLEAAIDDPTHPVVAAVVVQLGEMPNQPKQKRLTRTPSQQPDRSVALGAVLVAEINNKASIA